MKTMETYISDKYSLKIIYIQDQPVPILKDVFSLRQS